jgi:hypothetical protein
MRAVVLAVSLTMGFAAHAVAEMDLEAKIEAAQTAGDHEAIAAEYERLAHEATMTAARHDRMDNAYRGGRKFNNLAMWSHCKRLAENSRADAKELNALAEGHREMAKQLSK